MDIIKNFDQVSDSVFGEGNATLIKENDYIRVTDRNENYSSLAVHANKLLGNKQAYKSVWQFKLPEGAPETRIKAYHKIIFESLDLIETAYTYSDDIVLNDKEWVEVTLSTTVPCENDLIDFISYFYQLGGLKYDILVKKFQVEETEPEKLDERERNIPPVSKQQKRLVGTIRWDAFTKSTPDGNSPASQVARVLSYKEYHNQAPFFSEVNGQTVSFPEYTQEIWEKEAEYAIKGGLDYFAYIWYDFGGEMSIPRSMHLKSPNKDKIKLCGILDRIRNKATMDDLFNAMKDSCYLRLDNRPVLFIYSFDRWSTAEINRVTVLAKEAGIKEELYIVGMSLASKSYPFKVNWCKGIDAISWYSVGAKKKDMLFSELKNDCEEAIKAIGELCRINNIDIIPSFTAGRDTRARIRTGVSWCGGDPNAQNDGDKPYSNRYALPPSDKELEDHMAFTIKYVEDNPDITKSYMVLSYGWNEHEEGGWLCPTLAVDENNNVIRDEKGNILPDTKRLDILKKVVDSI